MRKPWRSLSLILLCLAAAASGAELQNSAEQSLLDSAQHWQEQGREDLALAALQKLALAHPEDPGLQLRIGVLELHVNRIADARTRLQALQTRLPQDPATLELAEQYQVATSDRLHMASVRRLVQIGQYDQALAAFNQIFPDGPPHGALGDEYFRILARTQLGRAAKPGARSPGNPARSASAANGPVHSRPVRTAKAGSARPSSTEVKVPGATPAPADARADSSARLDLAAEREVDAQRWSAAEAQYRDVMRLDSSDVAAPAGLAGVLAATNRWDEALRTLAVFEHYHPAAAAPIVAARASVLRSRADAATRDAQFGQAAKDLETALALTPADPWLRFDLARVYAKQGQGDRGRTLMTAGETLTPGDWDMRYADALYLSGQDDRHGALALLSTVPPALRTAGMLRLEQRLQLELATARADQLADSGRWAEAGAEYESLLRNAPGDLDLRLAYARLLARSGAKDAALSMLKSVDRDAAPADKAHRLDAARQLWALNDLAGARTCIGKLQSADPRDTETLLLAGQIAGKAGQRSEAFGDFQRAAETSGAQVKTVKLGQAPAGRDNSPQLIAIADAAADLAHAQPAYVSSGVDAQAKPGDPGISRFRDLELPTELRMPGPAAGTLMLQIDPVHVGAGTLPADFGVASQFGKVRAFGPTSIASFPGGASQAQSGVALGAGYYSEHYHLDLGTTPIGFLVQNISAGADVTHQFGPIEGTLGLSRRPVNSTLLSYAGARDPVSGEIWGGVMKSGLNTGIGHYAARWGANASAGYYRFGGRKVLGNNEFAARAYGYRLLQSSRDMDLALGLSATYWSYARNLRYYSFGQGGYYSPQSYLAIGLPLDWEGRYGHLAYELRGVVSKTLTHENSSPYYPTDALLQQQAGNPEYSGGSGSGIGYDLRANLEYQLDRHWFLGGHFEIDRSAFYSPDYLNLYVRYELTPHWWPVAYPPRAPLPYTQY